MGLTKGCILRVFIVYRGVSALSAETPNGGLHSTRKGFGKNECALPFRYGPSLQEPRNGDNFFIDEPVLAWLGFPLQFTFYPLRVASAEDNLNIFPCNLHESVAGVPGSWFVSHCMKLDIQSLLPRKPRGIPGALGCTFYRKVYSKKSQESQKNYWKTEATASSTALSSTS